MERIAHRRERYLKLADNSDRGAFCSAIAEKRFPTRTMSGQPVLAGVSARPINHLTFDNIIIKRRGRSFK